MVAAIVLAAGRSARLGRPKQLLRVGGRSLVRRAADAARDAGCDPVVVVLGADVERIRPEIASAPFQIEVNRRWVEGLSSSVRTGLAALSGRPDVAAVLLVACDQPHLDSAIVRRVLEAFDGTPQALVACAYAETVGTPALFGRALFGELLALTGDGGAKPILLRHERRLVLVPWGAGAIDLDRPGDLGGASAPAVRESDRLEGAVSRPLRGKTALVTGGARGIGRAICERLAEAGCDVALNYYNSSDAAEKLRQTLVASGVRALAIQANVSDASSVAELFQVFGREFDRLDFLVSNAASGVLKPALEMTTKHWRWCLETNALALNHLVREARPLLRPGSRVLALSSLGAERAIPNYAFIGASKAALESLVRSLSLELAPAGIAVNTISAGVVDTDALKQFPDRERLLAEHERRNLLGRELRPEDVAAVAYLLCLPESDAIRGQTIVVDGGYSIVG